MAYNHYSDPTLESDPNAQPDVEVFSTDESGHVAGKPLWEPLTNPATGELAKGEASA